MAKKDRDFNIILISIIMFTILFTSNMPITITGMVVKEVSGVDYILNDLDAFKEKYNDHIEEVPAFVKTMLGNEKIEMKIEKLDGTQLALSIEAQDGQIKQLTTEKFDEYTLEIQTDEQTINNINEAENQIKALKQALKDGEIKYKAKGLKTSLKTWFSNAILKIISWFQ